VDRGRGVTLKREPGRDHKGIVATPVHIEVLTVQQVGYALRRATCQINRESLDA
jgi:hypothetical protein